MSGFLLYIPKIRVDVTFGPNINLKGKILYHDGEGAKWVDPVIPQGTVTRIGFVAPYPFTVSSPMEVTTSGNLGFEVGDAGPGLFFASPEQGAGKLHMRPITNKDLPIVDVEHGGSGMEAPLDGKSIMISDGRKITQGPQGEGFLKQDAEGNLTIGKVEFGKDTAGKLGRYGLLEGIAVPDILPADSGKLLMSNGRQAYWEKERKPSIVNVTNWSAIAGAGAEFYIDAPKVEEAECVEFQGFAMMPEASGAEVSLGIDVGEAHITASYPRHQSIQEISIKFYRRIDKLIILVAGETYLAPYDFSKPLSIKITVASGAATEAEPIAPLFSKVILY